MSVVFDQVSRRYLVSIDSAYVKQVRTHTMPNQEERKRASSHGRKLRKGGLEVIQILKRYRPAHPSFLVIKKSLRHVPASTLHTRLSEMVRRGDILRFGPYGGYCYGVVASTMPSSTPEYETW